MFKKAALLLGRNGMMAKAHTKNLKRKIILLGGLGAVLGIISNSFWGKISSLKDFSNQNRKKSLRKRRRLPIMQTSQRQGKDSLIFDQLAKKIDHSKPVYHYKGC